MELLQKVLNQVVEQSRIEIYLVNYSDQKIFYANQAALDNIGYTMEELSRLTPTDINARHDESQLVEVTRPIALDKENATLVSFVNEHRRKDGTTYPAETHLQKIMYGGQPAYLAVVQDISERQHLLDQLNMVMEGGNIGYWDRRLDEDFVDIGRRSLEMIGLKPEEFSNNIDDWLALIHPEDLEKTQQIGQQAMLENRPWVSEYRMKHKDGHWVWILGTSKAFLDPETGEPIRICGTHVDITNRKLAEMESEQLYRFFDITEDMMAIADLEGRIRQVNSAAEKILGYSKEELMSTPILDFLHPDDREATLEDVQKIVETGGSFHHQNRYLHKDGSYRWLAWRSTFDAENRTILGMARDVTQQRTMEEELGRQQAMYKALAENTEDIISRFDREHRFLYTNRTVRNYVDLDPEEAHGKTMKEMGIPESVYQVMDPAIEDVFTTGIPTTRILEMNTKRGRVSLIVQVFPELTSENNIESVFSVSRDITYLREAEEENQKIQKLASLGVLAGGIAHDFNNILTILFGNLTYARSQMDKGEDCRNTLEKAESALHRATHLTSQLLTFAKGGDPIRANISIGELIEEIVSFDLSGSNVKVEYNLSPDLWIADVDKGLVSQVFSNLATNANQAMPNGGHIYLSAENYSAGEDEEPPLKPGRYLKFIFRDEGTGIPPSNMDKIFDPYYSTKQSGSGLGLATVHSIIQKHGGKISAESTPGSGASFTFYLPAADARKKVSRQEQKQDRQDVQSGRVLVMDDEDLICQLAQDVLESRNYQVSVVSDGESAIREYESALKEGNPYQCVLMDLTIPGGMGGADTIRELKKIDPGVKAVVTSGYASDPIMAHFEEHGFNDCLIKPFTMKSLLEKVSTITSQ